MKSVTVHTDLRQSALDELERLNKLSRFSSSGKVQCVSSAGAADRNYLLAVGLLERNGNNFSVTPEGEELLSTYLGDNEAR